VFEFWASTADPRSISFASLVNIGIDIIKSEDLSLHRGRVEAEIRNKLEFLKSPQAVKQMIVDLVLGWLENKNKVKETKVVSPVKRAAKKKNGEEELIDISEDIEDRYPMVSKFLTIWTREYVRIGVDLKINGFTNNMIARTLLVRGESNKGAPAGWYNLGSKDLAISTKSWPSDSTKGQEKGIDSIIRSNRPLDDKLRRLSENPLWQKLFAISYPATTVIHEIEHARRQIGGHDSFIGSLYPSDPPQTRNFEHAANDVYRKIITGNLYQAIFDAYK
jgi:hypothetical protein